jgi:mRNA-degrading endonuclease toxin of MazEF toxin-antitoxin module
MRGHLVIIDFSATNPNAGVRPGLVVQNDLDNGRMQNTIVAQVTTNTRRAAEPTQHLIDGAHPDWAASGLRHPSVINCSNLATVSQADIRKTIGALSPTSMSVIENCLKAALSIP